MDGNGREVLHRKFQEGPERPSLFWGGDMSRKWGDQVCIYCRLNQGPSNVETPLPGGPAGPSFVELLPVHIRQCHESAAAPGGSEPAGKLHVGLKQVPGLNQAHGPKKQFSQHFLHSCKSWNRHPRLPSTLLVEIFLLGRDCSGYRQPPGSS